MNGDLYSGRYSAEEIKRIMEINARPLALMKPLRPLYKKSATEIAPTWREKREVIKHISFNIISLVRSLSH